MKRSEINEILRKAVEFAKEKQFLLPPFAYWGKKEWATKGAEYNEIKEILTNAFKAKFKPEFVNRIDVVTVFHPLEFEHLSQIAKLFICNLNKRLQEKGSNLKITESALKYLIEKGYDREFGARPLRRLIEQEIEDKISEQTLEGNIPHGSVITISGREGKLSFRIARPENN